MVKLQIYKKCTLNALFSGERLYCGSRMEDEIYCFDTRWTNNVRPEKRFSSRIYKNHQREMGSGYLKRWTFFFFIFMNDE